MARAPHGAKIKVAGLVITRQRPATAKGMVFITLEDETGHVNLVVTPPVYERFREARDEVLLLCDGVVEREGDVVNVRTTRLARLAAREGTFAERAPRRRRRVLELRRRD